MEHVIKCNADHGIFANPECHCIEGIILDWFTLEALLRHG